MSSNVFAANVYYAGNVIVSQTLNVGAITSTANIYASNAVTTTNVFTTNVFATGRIGIGTTNPSTAASIAGELSFPTVSTGQSLNFTTVSIANYWYKLVSMQDFQAKCAFRVTGTIVGQGSDPHATNFIDVLITVDNVTGALWPKIDWGTAYSGSTLWDNFGLVYVAAAPQAVLYAKTKTATTLLNLNITAISKNNSGSPPVFFQNTSFSLAFAGTMSSTTDPALSASVTNFDVYTSANMKIKTWSESGNVGIGKTDPQTNLDVNGIVNIGQWNSVGTAADTTTYGLERSRYTLQFPTYRDAQNYKIGAKIIAINKQTYVNASLRQAIQSTDIVFFTTPPDTEGIDNSIERMRITDTGNVGIGTSSPGSALGGCLLDVFASGTGVLSNVNISAGCNGSASSSNKASLVMNIKGAGGGIVNGVMTYQLLGSGNYGLNLQAYAGTSVLAINGNGRVGVNTTDPAVALHVVGNVRGSLGDMGPILLVTNTALSFNVGDIKPFLEEGAGTTDYHAYFGAAYSVNPGNASGDGGSWSQWRLIIRYRGQQDFTGRSGTARNVEYHNTPAGNNYTAAYNISDSGGVRGCNTAIGPWQTLQNADVPGLGWNLISWTSGPVVVGSVHVQFRA